MQSIGDFDATIAAAGYRDTGITQEHATQKKSGGSQLSRDQTTREREREHMRARKGESGGGSQLSREQNKKKEST